MGAFATRSAGQRECCELQAPLPVCATVLSSVWLLTCWAVFVSPCTKTRDCGCQETIAVFEGKDFMQAPALFACGDLE